MRLDKFNNPVFNDTDIFNALYEGNISALSDLTIDPSIELSALSEISEINFKLYEPKLESYSQEEYDSALQSQWFMPNEYQNLDITEYCLSKCINDIERTRVIEEMTEFTNRNMIPVLQWLKFFVDVCIQNDIVWGVGRGSSVSSYVLYLIGTHRINSIKYNLDWQDFLR